MDVNKHKFFMLQILKDVFSDAELVDCLAFNGGTALMFFYGLPRFLWIWISICLIRAKKKRCMIKSERYC